MFQGWRGIEIKDFQASDQPETIVIHIAIEDILSIWQLRIWVKSKW